MTSSIVGHAVKCKRTIADRRLSVHRGQRLKGFVPPPPRANLIAVSRFFGYSLRTSLRKSLTKPLVKSRARVRSYMCLTCELDDDNERIKSSKVPVCFIVIPSLSSKTNVLVHDDKQKVEVLNNTFINQNTSTALHGFPFGPTETDSICNLQHITASKVRRVLSSLPSKSSTGTDGIPYRVLKEAGPALVGPLTNLFNISLRLSQVPDEWKRSVISPLFKGRNRDRQEAKNYGPISVT